MRRLVILALGGCAALIAASLDSYGQFVLGSVAASAIAVLAVSVLAGLTGIWSLGHMAFVAFGAYLATQLSLRGVPLELIVPAAILGAGLAGGFLGLSAGRFSVLYFGLLTMSLALATNEVIGHWRAVTGGDEGIAVTPARSLLLGRDLDLSEGVILAIGLATLACLAADRVTRGPAGRRWLAIKSQRVAASSIGLRPTRENALAFGFSAGMASLSGIALAYIIGYLDPVSFDLNAGVRLIVAAVVGGAGSIAGAVLGAAFITLIPELARNVPAVSSFVFGLATVLVVLFLRQGIVPALAGLLRRVRRDDARAAAAQLEPAAVSTMIAGLMPPATDDLVAEAVELRFGGVRALNGVGLVLKPGCSLGLIGPNGAGKTSFLNVLSGFYPPTSARQVRVGGHDLLRLDPADRTTLGYGRTFQHAELFDELTLRETFETAARLGAARRARLGLSAQTPQQVAQILLTGLGLCDVADARPGVLPFGTRKVADIGRVLACAASIVALDEPFAGLDAQERGTLRQIFQGMRQAGVSLLIVDHSVSEVMALSDRVTVFEFGQLLAEGTPDDIRRHPEVMRAYFGEDAGVAA